MVSFRLLFLGESRGQKWGAGEMLQVMSGSVRAPERAVRTVQHAAVLRRGQRGLVVRDKMVDGRLT